MSPPPPNRPDHQPIRAPGLHLMTHVGLSCRGRVGSSRAGAGSNSGAGRRRRKPLVASLQLTPLIDVMIVMVCFLLLNFKAEGQVCSCAREIDRPLACMAGPLLRAPIVAVSPPTARNPAGLVTLDGSEVSTLVELLQDASPDWKIARLTEQLEVKKHSWRMTNPGQRFLGTVIVDSDREVAFKALKKIIYSVGLAGYPEVHMAVDLQDPRATGRP